MVEELELPSWSMPVVAKLIDAFLLKTVRGWRPCVQVGQMIQAVYNTASANGMWIQIAWCFLNPMQEMSGSSYRCSVFMVTHSVPLVHAQIAMLWTVLLSTSFFNMMMAKVCAWLLITRLFIDVFINRKEYRVHPSFCVMSMLYSCTQGWILIEFRAWSLNLPLGNALSFNRMYQSCDYIHIFIFDEMLSILCSEWNYIFSHHVR